MKEFEFEHGNLTLKMRPIPALQQIKLVRKIAPVIACIAPAIGAALSGNIESLLKGNIQGFSGLINQFAAVISTLPDDDADYIIKTSLSYLLVKGDQDKWYPIVSNGQIMHDSIDAASMIVLTTRVLRENLSDFIVGLATNLMNGQPTA